MTVTGTLAELNAALNGLVYTPTTGHLGADSLQISATDSLDGFTGSTTDAISVVETPSVTAPASVSVVENGSYPFSGSIVLADPVAGTGKDSLSLSVADGKLTLGSTSGITITAGANGSSSMTISGTLTNLNASVNGLVYAPKTNYTGSDSLGASLTDPGDSLVGTDTIPITVSTANPPNVTSPGSVITAASTTYTFSGAAISVTDGSASGNSDSVTLTVAHGGLTLATITGISISSGSNGASSMTFSGTLGNLNAASSTVWSTLPRPATAAPIHSASRCVTAAICCPVPRPFRSPL